jgi:hypothetical protein
VSALHGTSAGEQSGRFEIVCDLDPVAARAPAWRRLLAPAESSFFDLEHALNIVFEWSGVRDAVFRFEGPWLPVGELYLSSLAFAPGHWYAAQELSDWREAREVALSELLSPAAPVLSRFEYQLQWNGASCSHSLRVEAFADPGGFECPDGGPEPFDRDTVNRRLAALRTPRPL